MSNKLLDLNGLSYFKLQQDAYNASTYATPGDIPTVNDATLTITQNGTSVGTFSANASSNVTAAITVPTATSDLTNDSGFITSSDLPTVNDATLTITQNGTTVATFTANSATNTSAAITVPTDVSDLNNDAGYITSSDIPTDVSDFTNDADYQSGSQVSSAIATAIAGITGIQFEIVQTLPATGDPGTIYLVPNSGSGTNIYTEYVYVNNTWEQIGTTAADFTDVAYYDSVNNQLSANSTMFWEIATNADIAGLFT